MPLPLALTPAQVASPLARRPYDLRHAAVSLWLNGGVPAPEVAGRAGHGVDVLLRVYAKCIGPLNLGEILGVFRDFANGVVSSPLVHPPGAGAAASDRLPPLIVTAVRSIAGPWFSPVLLVAADPQDETAVSRGSEADREATP
ncbi:hypothetical protein GCM10023259_098850 [Thermocatellispora tengchongensis]